MYQLLRTYVKTHRKWEEKEVNGVSLKDLLFAYLDVRISVTHPALSEPMIISLNHYRSKLDGLTSTLPEWLLANGTTTLTYVGTEREVMVRQYACQADAWTAGFKMQPTRVDAHPGNPIPEHLAREIYVWKEGLTSDEIWKNCLFIVNGFVHFANPGHEGVYLMEGNYNASMTQDNRVSVIDFHQLGGIEYVDIKEDSIISDEGLYIKLPKAMNERTLLLVLGGYLCPIDTRIDVINDDTVKLNLTNYPLLQRVLDAKSTLDYGQFLPPALFEDTVTTEILTDEVLLKGLLASPYSFIVAIGEKDVCLEERQLAHTSLPGKYLAPTPTKGLLQFSNGKLANYTLNGHRERFVITTQPEYNHHYHALTIGPDDVVGHVNDLYTPTIRRDPCTLTETLFYRLYQ